MAHAHRQRCYPDFSSLLSTLTFVGRVSDVDFGLAALHDLVGVTAGAKPRNDALSLFFSRRPQHGMGRGKVHI
jgi:hypothetical protein